MTTVPSMVSQQLGLLSSGADPADVRAGQSFIKPGSLAIQAGTMTDNGDLGTIVPGTTDVPIPEGYTTGGVVQGDADLVSSNIKAGTDIFGVTGTAVLATGNAVDANVLAGVTYSSGSGSSTGTMPNNGSLGIIIPDTTPKTIPAGYTTGGSVAGSINLIPSNIRSGTSIYGVTGSVIQASGSATEDKLLIGETASTATGVITGTMPNNGSLGTITPGTTSKPIPSGYTTGGSVAGSGNLQAGNIRLGVNIFGITGSLDPGTQTGGTADPGDVLTGETFTNDSGVQTGNMPNNGAINITPGSSSQTIPIGYHNGGGTVSAVTFDTTKVLTGTTIAGTSGTMVNNGDLSTIIPGIDTQAIPSGYTSGGTVAGDVDLVPGNIKSGVNIFGVTGTLEGTLINGQISTTLPYAVNIAKNDPIVVSENLESNSIPYSATNANGSASSPDGVYLAVVFDISPFVAIYKNSGGSFTKLPDPASLPPDACYDVAFSPDGNYLAIATYSSPFIVIYKRSGDVFTKLANPSVLPAGRGYGVSFSSDGTYLAVGHDTSPYITIYKRSGDTFTKLANPSVLPTGGGRKMSFGFNDSYLVIAHATTPFITIYKRSGDVFTKLSDPDVLPTAQGSDAKFSSDGTYLAVSFQLSPGLRIYKRSGDVFTKLPDPDVMPTSQGYGVSFSANDLYMAVAFQLTPFFLLYRRNGDVFTKLSNPDVLPTSRGNGVSFSPSSDYLFFSNATTPYFRSYRIWNKAYKSNNSVLDLRNIAAAGYALSDGNAGDTKDVVLIWR
ncbi:hypothetical protein [Paenibacillus sp. FSL R5-0486]|uniref:hypothetical protein n=1 Tax=Paenibacillus sp. FSL R5-0486 TaxID=2921645 RepID=UPI0030D704BD